MSTEHYKISNIMTVLNAATEGKQKTNSGKSIYRWLQRINSVLAGGIIHHEFIQPSITQFMPNE